MRNLPPYSFLYYKQLQSLFRPCGQVKKIAFDSSRYLKSILNSTGISARIWGRSFVLVPSERTWSSTNRPRSPTCWTKSLSPSSWDSSRPKPWSSPSTQLNRLNSTPGAGMWLIWNTHGTHACAFDLVIFLVDNINEFRSESAASHYQPI